MRKTYTFECECMDHSHCMEVYWGETKDLPELHIGVRLDNYEFWHRVKVGLQYIFGHAEHDTFYGTILLEQNEENAKAFQEMADYLKKGSKK